MDTLFSFLAFVIRIGMVIGGILAVAKLLSARKQGKSIWGNPDDKKAALVIILVTVLLLVGVIALTIIFDK